MSELSYALLGEGSNDAALVPVLTWLLEQHLPEYDIQGDFINSKRINVRSPAILAPRFQTYLAPRIFGCLQLHVQELLFIHRDIDTASRSTRLAEISTALQEVRSVDTNIPPVVCVLPIHMTEAWFLFDETAIRRASGHPNGRQHLSLPHMHEVEARANPKQILEEAMRRASGRSGRRLKELEVGVGRVAQLINEFSPLRRLTAFQDLEADLERTIHEAGWNQSA